MSRKDVYYEGMTLVHSDIGRLDGECRFPYIVKLGPSLNSWDEC